jgi:signal peptidase I
MEYSLTLMTQYNHNSTGMGHPEPSATPTTPYVPPRRASHAPQKKEGLGSVVSTVAVLLIAPLVALLLTAFVFQSYQVDGPSMETTLNNNDRLLVWKVPKTWSKITGNDYIPNRGDVVIFHESAMSNYGQDPGKQLIKRVVALPGERVVVKNGTVTVYNQENPEGFQPDKVLPYGSVIGETSGNIDTKVSSNHVFVMGDNRPNSLDSRAFGAVNSKDIVGKLILRVWPAGEMKSF